MENRPYIFSMKRLILIFVIGGSILLTSSIICFSQSLLFFFRSFLFFHCDSARARRGG